MSRQASFSFFSMRFSAANAGRFHTLVYFIRPSKAILPFMPAWICAGSGHTNAGGQTNQAIGLESDLKSIGGLGNWNSLFEAAAQSGEFIG